MDAVFDEKLNKLPKCIRDVMAGRLVKHDCTDANNQIVHDLLDTALIKYQLKKEKTRKRVKTTSIVAETSQPTVVQSAVEPVVNMSIVAEPTTVEPAAIVTEPAVEPVSVAESAVEPIKSEHTIKPVVSETASTAENNTAIDYCSTLFKFTRSAPLEQDTDSQLEPPPLLRLFRQQTRDCSRVR